MEQENKIYDIDTRIDENVFNITNSCEYYTREALNTVQIDGSTLSIIHLNTRSMYNKFLTLQDYLKGFKNKFSIVAITETWLKDDMINEVQMEGYSLYSLNRKHKKGGGVALYINSNLRTKIISEMTEMENEIEMITVEIMSATEKHVLVSCVYRPPESCVKLFIEKMTQNLERVRHKRQVICGDFNINFEKSNDSTITDVLNSLNCLGLFPLITRPTRITSQSATTIDNIFTNVEDIIIRGVLTIDISDHLPIFTVLKYNHKVVHSNTVKQKRNRSLQALGALNNDLNKQKWEAVYVNDVNQAYDSFIETVTRLYNKNCKIIYYKETKKDQPWITKGIKNACKKKNNLYRHFLKTQTKETESRYKKYKNKLLWIIKQRKKDYYSEKLMENQSNTKETWGIINSVTKGNNVKSMYPEYFTREDLEITEPKKIANEFSKYFASVGTIVAKKIPQTTNTRENMIIDNVNSIFIVNVEEEEIRTIVKNFGNKRSTDCEGFDMSILKNIVESIIEPFTYICNLSLKTGVFPEKMKIAKVIPLFKNGDKHEFTNYRPVSLLPQFSKILEKVFASRLNKFIDKENLLSKNQYGFRPKHSTALAIMELTEKISREIDNKNFLIGVFIDLQKAFDVINHSRLIWKLQKYGIRGIANKWITSYLKNRKQYVQINETKSDLWDINCGVPQGSILGPLLFLLYINDLPKASNTLQSILFADDTTLFYSGKNLKEVIEVVNTELIKIKHWFDSNKLVLNVNKTNFILFNDRGSNIDISLKIDRMEIQRVKETKFLGIIIDNELSWKPHIINTRNKVAKSIAVLYKVKSFLNQPALIILYNSLIMPYLTYGVEIWGTTYKTYTQPLFILQKKALKIINNTRYRDPSNPLFIKNKSLKFYDIVDYKILQILYKANSNNLPENIQERFEKRESCYNLKGTAIFKKPRFRTKIMERTVTIKGTNLWNGLQTEIKEIRTIMAFKKNIKSTLLAKYERSDV